MANYTLIFQRIGLTEADFKQRLLALYNRPMSMANVASQLGIGLGTVRKWLDIYDVPRHACGECSSLTQNNNKWEPTSKKLSVLDGLLLGDGSLYRGSQCSAVYQHSSKYIETVQRIERDLGFCGARYYTRMLGGRVYHEFRTRYIRELLPIFLRWYKPVWNSKKDLERWIKFVPTDIVLDCETLYNWYIGDGHLLQNRYIYLATNGFSLHCRHLLQEKMNDMGLHTNLPASGLLYVKSVSVPFFFELIGPCMNPEYKYKWDYRKIA